MKPVLRQIAIRSILTAVLLAVVGVAFAELASIWLASSASARAAAGGQVQVGEVGNTNDELASSLRRRIPLMMAIWGFSFVLVGEAGLYLWRKRKPVLPAPTSPQPDAAEKLLEDLLQQVESRKVEVRDQRAEAEEQKTESGHSEAKVGGGPPAG